MLIASLVFVTGAILIHIYIWVLETFLWDQPKGMKVFGSTPERAAITKEMAVNQGLYNLMLALVAAVGAGATVAGASWGPALIFAGAGSMAVAGIFLFLTSPDKRKPALIQLVPPLLGVLLLAVA
ncbi:DUF1304 domain-containing protein [Rothia terrae]|uniref:DUF1304 domain-containing protein n=1 Tax=Rothia terrae TaxID=396015 RepID=UPI0014472100|nr:DUF1304 domain-containing protein [Rothia terrae]NKZ34709.1 DUF1304 domain-containing protein [Rothia terrae]